MTRSSNDKRVMFLQRHYNYAKERLISTWKPKYELLEIIKTEDVREDKKGDYWLNIFLRISPDLTNWVIHISHR